METFARDTFFARMLLEQAQSESPHQRQVLRSVAPAHAILVFGKRHIQLPVQGILDSPVMSQRGSIHLRRRLAIADEVAHLLAGFTVLNAFVITHADDTQARPLGVHG